MTEDDDKKVFYLFTKTAREKEEWFNHFMVAAKFMEDWEHQNPKEGLLKNYVYIRQGGRSWGVWGGKGPPSFSDLFSKISKIFIISFFLFSRGPPKKICFCPP